MWTVHRIGPKLCTTAHWFWWHTPCTTFPYISAKLDTWQLNTWQVLLNLESIDTAPRQQKTTDAAHMLSPTDCWSETHYSTQCEKIHITLETKCVDHAIRLRRLSTRALCFWWCIRACCQVNATNRQSQYREPSIFRLDKGALRGVLNALLRPCPFAKTHQRTFVVAFRD